MTPNPNPSPELREAIAAAKIKARDVLGIAWHNLEEISRFELVLANFTPPPRHDADCGLLYDDGPEECTCEPDPLRKAAKTIVAKLEESEASFARNVANLPDEPPISDDDGVCISVGDLRALRTALATVAAANDEGVASIRRAIWGYVNAQPEDAATLPVVQFLANRDVFLAEAIALTTSRSQHEGASL